MLHDLMLVAALFGMPGTNSDEALAAVQGLYQYATQAVAVEATEVRQRLAEIEQHLGSPSDPVAQALEALAAEVRKEQPNGRDIRVAARELYQVLETERG